MRARAGLALAVLLVGLAGSAFVWKRASSSSATAEAFDVPTGARGPAAEADLAVAAAPPVVEPEAARTPEADPAPRVFEPPPAEPRHARLRLLRRPDGGPLTGVEVAVTDRVSGYRHLAGPDAGGHVDLPWLEDANGRELQVEADGHEPAFAALPLGGDLRRAIEVELWPSTGVFGRVVLDGEPAPGRRVVGWAAEIPTPRSHTRVIPMHQSAPLEMPMAAWPVAASGPTDDEGRFWIPPPPRPVVGDLWLWADEPGWTSDLRWVPLRGEPAREDAFDVVLREEVLTRGEVLDDLGDPLPGARVFALLPVTGTPAVDRVETDAQGRFALRAPIDPMRAVGGPCLHVESLGWTMAPPLDGLQVVLGSSTAEEEELTALDYVDPDTGTAPTFPLAAGSAPPGAAVVWGLVPAECVPAGSTGVVLPMERYGPIEVIVLDDVAGTPIEGARLRARFFFRTTQELGAVTDARGRATVEVAAQAKHATLDVSADGFESLSTGWWWLRNLDDPYQVRLRPARPAPAEAPGDGGEVRVTGHLEGPWRGAGRTRVDAHAIRGDVGWVSAARPVARDVALQGDRFELVWRSPVPGERLVVAAWSGDAARPSAGATWGLAGPLDPDEAAEREVVVALADAVPFQLVLHELSPRARYEVSVLIASIPGLPPIHRATVPVPAGAEGDRTLEVLAPVGGLVSARLVSRFPGFTDASSAPAESVVPSWPGALELTAEPWLELDGSLVGRPAQEAAQLAVAAVRLDDGGQRLTLSDADGAFHLEGLRAGPHALIVYAPVEEEDGFREELGLGPRTRVLARVQVELSVSIDGIEIEIGGGR